MSGSCEKGLTSGSIAFLRGRANCTNRPGIFLDICDECGADFVHVSPDGIPREDRCRACVRKLHHGQQSAGRNELVARTAHHVHRIGGR